MSKSHITVTGASEHNLKHISVKIPRDALTVITGLSGSGKSSLAFDTLYAEGQRRFVESLSAYARQFLEQMHKPQVESIDGLSPAISIEQKTVSKNPRSTVGTVTEVYDYLRLLWANLGEPHCHTCGRPIRRQTVQEIVDAILRLPEGSRLLVLAPIVRGRKGEYRAVFEALVREGFQRAKVNGQVVDLNAGIPKLAKTKKHDIAIVVDRLRIDPDQRRRLTDSAEIALKRGEGLLEVEVLGDGKSEVLQFSERFACLHCGSGLPELTPRMFSFNSPHGACPACKGLGTLLKIDEDLIIPDRSLSVTEGAIVPFAKMLADEEGRPGKKTWTGKMIEAMARAHRVNLRTPWAKLPQAHRDLILHGTGRKYHAVFKSTSGSRFEGDFRWEGVITNLERRHLETQSEAMREWIAGFMTDQPCPACRGMRLRPEVLAVRLGGKSIIDFTRLDVAAALAFIESLAWTERQLQIGGQAIREVKERLGFLANVGLTYLTLDRAAGTLSGGEGQRIRLATQIGSQLTGVLYVLDEPSIGLHQRDNRRLIDTLHRLRDLGNTVVVVEHDEATIRAADWVIDLGPGAGSRGGWVVAEGTPAEVMASDHSLTGKYLRGERSIPAPAQRRQPAPGSALVFRGCAHHNLRGVDVTLPLGLLICVTGVSGSGKSSLVVETIYPALAQRLCGSTAKPGAHRRIEGLELIDKVIEVDQAPIGRTPRSNPATYIGLFSLIRDLFAALPEAKVRGYRPGRFSFNVKGGRCESCQGDGLIRVEMHFLPDVYVECEACKGRRFNRETLEVLFKGKSIADVLEMTVDEAHHFFSAQPLIHQKLETLRSVGLGYITLGQSATTLSGGEAQRVKLSKELSKRNTGRTLYILDEPTTGLHFEDIRKLLEVLSRLVDSGSTVVVIEHNLDVIRAADWVIDLGPEGGEGGGLIVAQGPPEHVAAVDASHTGRFLAGTVAASH
ncbi:MAG: excinuclease ABC subunit UvrA [Candidatus Sumerlaeia bacterium]|nr:excinuclease ABC subunit UvrA [Candidatus Sumerlaeia bacterium]